MLNNLPKLPADVSRTIYDRLTYYKDLHARDQISDEEYIFKLAILKHDLNKEIDKLHAMEK